MRAHIKGEVVECDRLEYNFAGRSGISYAVLIRAEGQSAAQGAQRVKVTPEQFGSFAVGDVLDADVDIFANTVERSGVITGAKLSVQLDQAYSKPRAPGHAKPAPLSTVG